MIFNILIELFLYEEAPGHLRELRNRMSKLVCFENQAALSMYLLPVLINARPLLGTDVLKFFPCVWAWFPSVCSLMRMATLQA